MTLISALVAGPAFAVPPYPDSTNQPQAPARFSGSALPIEEYDDTRAPVFKSTLDLDQRSDARIIPVQAQIRPDVQLKRGSGRAFGDDSDYYFKVESKPPSRDRLFTLGSEDFFLGTIESEFKEQDPSQIFLVPAPKDTFDSPDSPNLGPLWFQNRETGRRKNDAQDHRGDMELKDRRGVYTVGAPPEVAILNESVGTSDMIVTLNVELGSPDSEYGLVARAIDPNTWIDTVDQIKISTFYFAYVDADTVTIGKSVKGKREIIKTGTMAAKTSFQLQFWAFENKLTVRRDGQVILEATDDSIKEDAQYAGMIGLKSVGQPTTFDNFDAVRYGGPFEARQFAPTASIFKGPNVHYHPLYFEQVSLERWGQNYGNLVQPAIAQGKFWLDLIFVPYSIGKNPPWTCQTGNGQPMPGDIVLPYRILPPYPDPGGIALECATMGLIFGLIP
ncbi:hypothetical protein [Planctomycetes bacterium Pan216]|uniref:hypothetical protein n=1 Tax=Kolteria novifilia TaxID=2527975 RepID=UPI0011A00E58